MVEIKLQFGILLFDDEDYPRIKNLRFYLSGKKRDIICTSDKANRYTIGRFILNYSGPLEVDHIDRNIFNNQKSNLRLATKSQQMANRGPIKNKKYKGVSYHKRDRRYQAILEKDGKPHFGGYHYSEIAAALAYDRMAKHYFGEFAYLNFPEK